LRAIAVLGVVAYHLGFGWAKGGLLGVAVFFVLSGYLITDLLLAEYRGRRTVSLRLFWLRRARRLLPALFVMLVVTVTWATLIDRTQLAMMRRDVLPAIFYYSNWWNIFEHLSYFARFGPPSPFSHLWSLAVEEQFYLLWPLLLLAALRVARRRWVIVSGIVTLACASALEMALLYSPVADATRVYDGTDTRAFELLIGAALAFAWPRDRRFAPISRERRRLIEGAGLAALVAILAFYWRAGQYDPFVYRGGMVILSLASALIVAICVHPGTRFGRVLGMRPLRWVGERSYAIYLWQLPVILLTTSATSAARPLWHTGLQFVAVMALAAASWRLIEEPVRHGALARLVTQVRGGYLSLRPEGRSWAAVSGAAACAIVCVLGLSGTVPVAAVATGPTHDVLPPAHRVERVGAVSASVPGSTSTTPVPTPTTSAAPSGQGVTAIGDSIMIDAAPNLQQLLPGIVIDAQVGQQLDQLESQAAQLRAQGTIGTTLILELGTNGYFSVPQLQGLLQSFGPVKRVVLVNTREDRPWEQAVNQTIATVASSWPGATMVDWYDASADQPQWFYPDGVHLNPTGAAAYAQLVVAGVAAATSR
jgi:peptidoglycan/LPS O-acetylase OafA/YrhL